MKRLTTQATIDDKQKYTMTAELETVSNKFNTKYNPRMEMTMPGRNPIKFGGSILYRDGKRADIDLSLENLSQKPMTVKGKNIFNIAPTSELLLFFILIT